MKKIIIIVFCLILSGCGKVYVSETDTTTALEATEGRETVVTHKVKKSEPAGNTEVSENFSVTKELIPESTTEENTLECSHENICETESTEASSAEEHFPGKEASESRAPETEHETKNAAFQENTTEQCSELSQADTVATHVHEYCLYEASDYEYHKLYCSCGEYITLEHEIISENTSDEYKRYCKDCGLCQLEYNYKELINDCYSLVNTEREKAGLPALAYNYGAQFIADRRAKEIITDFSHNGMANLSDEEREIIGSCGGENIANGYDDAELVMMSWMNSPGHRNNILSAVFTGITIAVHYDPETNNIYWVQLFG